MTAPRLRALLACLPLLGSLACSTAPAAPAGTTGVPGEPVIIGPELLDPVIPHAEPLAEALAQREHRTAAALLAGVDRASLYGHQVDDLAFLLAWTRIRAGEGAKSTVDIEVIRKADHVPPAYQALVLGELLLEDGRAVEAAEVLARVDEGAVIWPRARLALAQAQLAAGNTAAARETWQGLADRPDPSEGTAFALLALARRQGLDNPASYPHLRRIWAAYPQSVEARESLSALVAFTKRGSAYQATADDLATRADALMEAWQHQSATDLVQEHKALFAEASAASCKARYAWGRSHFKRNNVTLAAEILIPTGEMCRGIDEDRGAKSFYIAGKSLERKKEWAAAARAYERIPALYPEHSMADDGYALAGVAWQIAGEDATALARWEAQVDAYPKGDLAGEGFWRLAWTAYRSGDTEGAIRWAERMVWDVPIENDPVHVLAARYWAARWRLYPDFDAPTVLNSDPVAVTTGLQLLARLCQEHPTRFYALLAAQRLHELAPERVDTILRPEDDPGADGSWTVRAAFLEEPAVARGISLARLGLVREAVAELDTLDGEALTPSETAFVVTILARADWLRAHDRLHKYLHHHPPSTLGVDRHRILRTAYPNRYWSEVQTALAGKDLDPRVFHALVREESSFNERIVSWAGARGLSQLMPATAREVGGRLGIRVTDEAMFDPATNLLIGGTYLDNMLRRYDGNPFLAVPSYNAGPGNVDKWLVANDGRPTDEYVESIPIRETRHYVKRVLGTYQLYRYLYDEGPLFPDWSHTNHRARRAP